MSDALYCSAGPWALIIDSRWWATEGDEGMGNGGVIIDEFYTALTPILQTSNTNETSTFEEIACFYAL